MKKKIVFSTVSVFIVCFMVSCASTTNNLPDDLYVSPDTENPFTGTWFFSSGNSNYMHVIQGMNGALYVKAGLSGWSKNAVYTIEQNDDTYMTSNNWRIRVDGNILTVEDMTYERVVK